VDGCTTHLHGPDGADGWPTRSSDGPDGAPYLQLGWLDGVGVARSPVSTTTTKLIAWEGVPDLQAFDHTPFRSIMTVEAYGCDKLTVFMGCIKLDDKFPRPHAVRELLYGNPNLTADNADVVALFCTDLKIQKVSFKTLQNLLKRSLNHPDDYVVNEDDPALTIKHIPAVLTSVKEGDSRYLSMHVAVKRTNILERSLNDEAESEKGKINHEDCFPQCPTIIAKSPRKNDGEPSFKCVLAQELLLVAPGGKHSTINLLLLGANFDTDDSSKDSQVEDLERYILGARQGKPHFSCSIWGDFNNRLVATAEFTPHVEMVTDKKGNEEWVLSEAGAQRLVSQISTQEGRRSLLQTDSLWYEGQDVFGHNFRVPDCHQTLRKLFFLHVDLPGLELPLPTYKRSPWECSLGKMLNTRLTCRDVISQSIVANRISGKDKGVTEAQWRRQVGEHSWDLVEMKDLAIQYFGWKENAKDGGLQLQREIKIDGGTGNAYLQLGWLDGVGVVKDNILLNNKAAQTHTTLLSWETADDLLAFDHVPTRSEIRIDLTPTAFIQRSTTLPN